MAYHYNGAIWCDECADKQIEKMIAQGFTHLPERYEPKKALTKPAYCMKCSEFLPIELSTQGISRAVADLFGQMQLESLPNGQRAFREYNPKAKWKGDEPWPLHMAGFLLRMKLNNAEMFLVENIRANLIAAMKKKQSEPTPEADPVSTWTHAANSSVRWEAFSTPNTPQQIAGIGDIRFEVIETT